MLLHNINTEIGEIVQNVFGQVLNFSYKQSTTVGHITCKAEYYMHAMPFLVLTRSGLSGTAYQVRD